MVLSYFSIIRSRSLGEKSSKINSANCLSVLCRRVAHLAQTFIPGAFRPSEAVLAFFRCCTQVRFFAFSLSPTECISIGMANTKVIRSDRHDEARERIAEIGELLALGLVRLRARQSTSLSAATGDSLRGLSRYTERSCRNRTGDRSMMKTENRYASHPATPSVLARLAALKTTPTPELKQQWRDLFETEPPPYNRALPREPAGLPHPGTGLWRAEAGDGGAAGGARRAAATAATASRRGRRDVERPADRRHAADPGVAGRRALRHGRAPTTSSTQGRPYKSLSAVARAITGTRWNGWVFFGLKNQRGRS